MTRLLINALAMEDVKDHAQPCSAVAEPPSNVLSSTLSACVSEFPVFYLFHGFICKSKKKDHCEYQDGHEYLV